MRFKKLSYASENDPRFKRWLIRSIEGLSGRNRYVRLYEIWRTDIVPSRERVFGKLLDLLDVDLDIRGNWPAVAPEGRPLVIVANHPFGIGDGIAVLSLAEQIGRPFRVLIHNELLKVPEMADYSLPVAFEETKAAVALNMETRREAVRLLREGVTVVIFPGGGVATAKNGFGRAQDLPWKMFPAKARPGGWRRRFAHLFRGAERSAVSHRQPVFADASAIASDPGISAVVGQDDRSPCRANPAI